jgi:hypothetical protein
VKLARLLVALLLLAVGAAAAQAAGDTGTYEIVDYRAALTPHADGKVGIDYSQQWRVTGGHIPWITVGLPNASFAVMDWGGAARSISPANRGDWSGVRIDLDHDYQSGQTFAVSFSVSQDKLFYAKDENYRLDFTPGWYDRARIDALEVRLKSFAKTETITANPQPDSISGDELIWTKAGLGEGERFPISISFPKAAAPGALPEGSLRQGEGAGPEGVLPAGGPPGSMVVPIIIAILIFVLIIYFISRFLRGAFAGGYSGGDIFYGGYPDWGRDGDRGHPRRTGGGGGFGGSGLSCVCACACVSCACACACAGGGGAGCSRKAEHRCVVCEGRGGTTESRESKAESEGQVVGGR